MAVKSLALFVIIVAFVGSVAPLKCHLCTGSGCEDPFKPSNDTMTNECDGYCVKSVVDSGFGKNTARSCMVACNPTKVDSFGIFAETNCCSTDLCNGASGRDIFKTFFTVASVLTLLYNIA